MVSLLASVIPGMPFPFIWILRLPPVNVVTTIAHAELFLSVKVNEFSIKMEPKVVGDAELVWAMAIVPAADVVPHKLKLLSSLPLPKGKSPSTPKLPIVCDAPNHLVNVPPVISPDV